MTDSESRETAPQADDPVSKRRGIQHGVLLLIALVGPPLIFALTRGLEPDPRGFGTHEQLGLPACPTLERFGVPCPACGVTTSIALVYRGHLLQGLRTQPFGFLVAAALPAFSLWVLLGHLRGRDRYRDLVDRPRATWIAWVATVVLAAWLWKIRALR